MPEAFSLFIRENVNDMYFIALFCYVVELFLKEYLLSGPASEQYRQIEIFSSVSYCLRHREERCNTASSCQSYNMLRIAQRFIIEVALRSG